MAGFFRNHSNVIIALGAGIAVGATVTVLVHRVSNTFGRDLVRLAAQIEGLKRDLEMIRTSLDEKKSRPQKKTRSGFYSVHASSGEDDDDEFQEAYQGYTSGEDQYLSAQSGDDMSGAVDTQQLFEQVGVLLDGSDADKEQAFRLLEAQQRSLESDAGFLWRLAKAAFSVSQIEGARGNDDQKKQLIYRSQELALKSLEYDDMDANAHKWCAIALGSVGDYEGTQAKILNGYKFKEHIEKAIKIDPNDASSLHLMGRWCYGVYMLSWLERKAASALFATPPTATVEDALEHFLKAEKLSSIDWKENRLFIAKCYVELRDYYEAVSWLDRAKTIPDVSQDDRDSQKEIDQLLYKYSGYRR